MSAHTIFVIDNFDSQLATLTVVVNDIMYSSAETTKCFSLGVSAVQRIDVRADHVC